MDFDALDPATPGDFESDPVMRRRTLLIGLPAMAAGGAVVALGGDWLRRKDEVTEIGPASALVLPGKQVWGHMIAHGLPDASAGHDRRTVDAQTSQHRWCDPRAGLRPDRHADPVVRRPRPR